MKPIMLALVMCLVAAPAMAAQQVYTWTDAQGVKHYSDSPPPTKEADAKRLKMRGGTTTEEVDQSAAGSEANPNIDMAKALGYSPEDIKRNCEVAQRNVEALSRTTPVDADDATMSAHQVQVDKAEKQVQMFCG